MGGAAAWGSPSSAPQNHLAHGAFFLRQSTRPPTASSCCCCCCCPSVCLQVVIIAAGYDTRAYRLASPGVRFYEIDLPHASKKKQELVAEHMPKDKVRCTLLY